MNWSSSFLFQVVSVSQKEKVKQRPQALNTVEMLRVASNALGTAGLKAQSCPCLCVAALMWLGPLRLGFGAL